MKSIDFLKTACTEIPLLSGGKIKISKFWKTNFWAKSACDIFVNMDVQEI